MKELPLRPLRPERDGITRSVFAAPASRAFTGKPVEGGEIAHQRRLSHRLVQDGERTYHAYSADELIKIDSLARHGRPGMPY